MELFLLLWFFSVLWRDFFFNNIFSNDSIVTPHAHINLISIAISANVIFITSKIIDGLQLKHLLSISLSHLDLSAHIKAFTHEYAYEYSVVELLFFSSLFRFEIERTIVLHIVVFSLYSS